MRQALFEAASKKLIDHKADLANTLPSTQSEIEALFDQLRPEGAKGMAWPGVRKQLAEHFGLKVNDPTLHAWASAAIAVANGVK